MFGDVYKRAEVKLFIKPLSPFYAPSGGDPLLTLSIVIGNV